MDINQAKKRIEYLSETLKYHNRKYYLEDAPEISDSEFDAMFRELEDLEKEYPEFLREDSPTQNVGGAAMRLFTPVEHTVKMESLQDVFNFDELRSFGEKIDTNAVIEILMLKDLGNDEWECLTKPAKRVKVGTIVKFSNELKCECTYVGEDGIRKYKFIYDGILLEILDRLGEMPLPPYITEKLEEKDRYQTVYAKMKNVEWNIA